LVSNLYLAMTHTKQKEMMEMKKARVVPNLASTLVGENIKAQVEELLPPQHNVAAASKKALDGGVQPREKRRSKNLLIMLKYQQKL
jgi:hypothetical protein